MILIFTLTVCDAATGAGRPVPLQTPLLLSTALQNAGIAIAMPCSGRGTCGKCAVWVRGAVSPPSAQEHAQLERLFAGKPPAEGFVLRLACHCRLEGDCRILLPNASGVSILMAGEGVLPPADACDAGDLGIVVDIGTTTVVLQLYDLAAGRPIAVQSALNRQSTFGADVLSRIQYANEHGLTAPHQALVDQLQLLLTGALAQAGAPADRVRRAVVTGNTTMLHFAAGLNPQSIGVYPFTPQSLFGEERSASTLFPSIPDTATLYYPRCISAYVGADITCGMLATGLSRQPAPTLLVDVGTNGEMVLCAGDRLLCCATAAGPAFEGAQITMGMTAADGAICRVRLSSDGVDYDTINGAAPCGICGTGLISLVDALLACGALDESGALLADGHAFRQYVRPYDEDLAFHIGDSSVLLTGRDIRQVQLAKAAIAAGIHTLLHEAAVPMHALGALILAGGFGSTIDPTEAAGIGLIPPALAPKARAAGNVALMGAAAMLLSAQARRPSEQEALRVQEVPLSTNPYFMDQYMEQMMFAER